MRQTPAISRQFLMLCLWSLLLSTQRIDAQTVATPSSSKSAEAEPFVAPRELLVVKPSVDRIWGTWVTAVIHRGTVPRDVSFRVNLPREAVDFQAGEGIEAKDLKLENDGIWIRKTFAPGVNVVSVLFATPARFGISSLTLVPKQAISELTVMTPSGLLKVESDGLTQQGGDHQDGQRYDVYGAAKPLAAGVEFKIILSGVPEGRGRLWTLGAISAALLVVAASWLAWKTRPAAHGKTLEGEFA